ncbi:MAG: hypothetical protein K2N32_01555, partial [Clostridia bacterium]|nr:hypothetical protein [Clostridia bacterium]
MRNKRLIISVFLLIVMIVSICAFAGCKPEDEVSPAQVLMSFYNEDTKPTVNSVELTNLKDYNIVNVYDNVLVARKIDDAGVTYALLNIAENKIIATSENNFNQ